MILDNVDISNFRSIKQTSVSFDPKCRVLVGINESGKSNILRALALLSTKRALSRKNDVRESLPDEDAVSSASVRFNFFLEAADFEELESYVSKKVLSKSVVKLGTADGKPISISKLCSEFSRVCYHIDLIKETRAYRFFAPGIEVEFDDRWHLVTKECPEDLMIDFNGKSVPLKSFGLVNRHDFAGIDSRYTQKASVAGVNSFIAKELIQIATENHQDAVFWEYDEKNLLPAEVDLDDFAEKPHSIAPLRNMFRLAGVREIAKEIAHVKTLSRNGRQNFFDKIAKHATTHFRSVWKEYKNIEFQLVLDGDKIIPGIRERNSFDFAKRSDGFKRFVTFLLMISVSVKTDNLTNALLLIDEPDYGLHPSGCRYLRDELLRISAKNSVVYSTHSIFMIDADEIERHYIVKKKDETTSIETATAHNIADEEVLYNALGYSVFEALREKNIIFEGWRDKQLFKTALAKSSAAMKSRFKDVGICHGKGASHIRTITPSMELANRKCLIVSDSDETAKREKRAFNTEKGYGDWCIYQDVNPEIEAITGEDFLKNSWVLKHANDVIEILGLRDIQINELPASGKLRAIATWLREKNVEDQQIRQKINELKEALFESLPAKEIEEGYEKLIEGIASKLGI